MKKKRKKFSGSSSEILTYEDIEKIRAISGSSSIMIARKALAYPSIFSSIGLATKDEEIKNFLKLVNLLLLMDFIADLFCCFVPKFLR